MLSFAVVGDEVDAITCNWYIVNVPLVLFYCLLFPPLLVNAALYLRCKLYPSRSVSTLVVASFFCLVLVRVLALVRVAPVNVFVLVFVLNALLFSALFSLLSR